MEVDTLEPLRRPPFAKVVAELEKLMSQSNRAFLLGAGCSHCAGLPLTTQLTEQVADILKSDEPANTILAAIKDRFKGSKTATIEDYMSELVDLLAIAGRREQSKASTCTVSCGASEYSASELRTVLDKIKSAVEGIFRAGELDVSVHWNFIKAVHETLRSGKATTDRPVDYFVLNYDNMIEDALALQRLLYTDGFCGGKTGWWDPNCYKRTGLDARVLKVHGSIDWCQFKGEPLPRRVSDKLKLDAIEERVMIWPAATKYRETQRDPYAQIIATMRGSLRPSKNSEVVLAMCGYRFEDAHINLEINNALHESEKALTLLVFTEQTEPAGQIEKWFKDVAVNEQVLIYGKRGFFHGALAHKSTEDLPWWKFEVLTRLLGGER